MNHTCPSRRAYPHFGRYLFSVVLRVADWVGLSGWLQTEVVYPRRRSPSPVLTGPSVDRDQRATTKPCRHSPKPLLAVPITSQCQCISRNIALYSSVAVEFLCERVNEVTRETGKVLAHTTVRKWTWYCIRLDLFCYSINLRPYYNPIRFTLWQL